MKKKIVCFCVHELNSSLTNSQGFCSFACCFEMFCCFPKRRGYALFYIICRFPIEYVMDVCHLLLTSLCPFLLLAVLRCVLKLVYG